MTTDTTPLTPCPHCGAVLAMDAALSPPQPTQAQAGPISGAKSFQTYAEANAYSRGYYAGKKAAKQPQAGAVPLTDEQIQDLLLCGDPTDEEMRLIRIGWDAARGIKGGQHG